MAPPSGNAEMEVTGAAEILDGGGKTRWRTLMAMENALQLRVVAVDVLLEFGEVELHLADRGDELSLVDRLDRCVITVAIDRLELDDVARAERTPQSLR